MNMRTGNDNLVLQGYRYCLHDPACDHLPLLPPRVRLRGGLPRHRLLRSDPVAGDTLQVGQQICVLFVIYILSLSGCGQLGTSRQQ